MTPSSGTAPEGRREVAARDFDKASRYAARVLDPDGFLRWLLGEGIWSAWRWAGWLDTQSVPFPGEPDRRCDTVARFERRAQDAPPMAAVIEFMSVTRTAILERLGEYVFRVRREQPAQTDPRVPYDVIGVVVNLTGETLPETWEMIPPDCDGLGLSLRVRVRNLATVEANATLAAVESGLVARCILAWVPLMRGGGEAATVAEWRRLADAEPDAVRRGNYGGLARVFANLIKRQGVWRKGLEGWNVERPDIVLEWEATGEARGEARGRLLTTRANLLRALKVRLNQEPPADVVQAVQSQEDLAKLDEWFDRALTANNLDEVRAALGLGPG